MAKLSSVLYHKTGESKAIKILEENTFRLSTWLGGEADDAKTGHMWFLSTSTRTGAYSKDSSGVIFVLDGSKLSTKYEGMPFDYWGQGKNDEAEERILSHEPTIKNASAYIKELHADWWMGCSKEYEPHAFARHRKLTLLAKKLGIPLFWYEDSADIDKMDKSKAKPFSSFEKKPLMKLEDMKTFNHGPSAYSHKKWTALLSIYPAKKWADLPTDISKYISSFDRGGDAEGYMADIHNASKGEHKDAMRYVYKVQTQMKLAGAKTFPEFFKMMVAKLNQLYKDRTLKQKVSAKYNVIAFTTYKPTPTYGFIKTPKEEDVIDALQEVSDTDWVCSRTSDYKSGEDIGLDDFHLKLDKVILEDPDNLQDISAFMPNTERGFLKSVDPSNWAAEMKDAASRDYTHIVKQKLDGKMCPAITINGEFGDGRGRTLLQYALDEPVLVAQYTTDLDIVRNG